MTKMADNAVDVGKELCVIMLALSDGSSGIVITEETSSLREQTNRNPFEWF